MKESFGELNNQRENPQEESVFPNAAEISPAKEEYPEDMIENIGKQPLGLREMRNQLVADTEEAIRSTNDQELKEKLTRDLERYKQIISGPEAGNQE